MSLWADQNDAMLALCVQTFGIPVTYQRPQSVIDAGAPGTTDPWTLQAIFGHPNQEDTEVAGQQITLDVRIADFAGTPCDPVPLKGDTALIPDGEFQELYTVYLIQVDAEGSAKLWMTRTITLT